LTIEDRQPQVVDSWTVSHLACWAIAATKGTRAVSIRADETNWLPDETGLTQALAYGSSYLAFRQGFERIPGVQAAVWADGGLRLNIAHGVADQDAGTALTTRHLFRIASHSKTVTATLVLQFVETGALRLDDSAGHHVPELAESSVGDRTIRELLSHSAGLFRDSSDGDFWQLHRSFPDRAALVEVLRGRAAPVLAANDRFKYSNIGFGLLGLVIESVSGSTFAELVRQRITDRLGLRDFGPEYDPARAAEFAAGHSSLAYADRRSRIEHVDTAALAAATGCYSSAADLVRYFAAHRFGDPALLTDGSKRLMQQAQWDVGAGSDRRYGLGLALTKVGERELIGHGGGYPGHITCSVADPRAGLAVSVLTNAIDGPAQALTHALVKLIELAGSKPRPDAVAIDPARFTGRFASLWGVLDIALLGGRLYRIHPAQVDPTENVAELRIVDRSTLRIAGGDGYGSFGEPITFTFDDSDAITGIRAESQVSMLPLGRFSLPTAVKVATS
jgi:CubicO group peptidase (beta-lactamase class C family)